MNPHMTICDVCNQRSYTPNEVHFCPLHEWAHELLKACQAVLRFAHVCESCDGWGKLQDTDNDACRDCGGVGEIAQVGPELRAIRATIAKATSPQAR